MNDKVEIIKRIRTQLKTLNEIKKKGEYLAAGLTVDINVGEPSYDQACSVGNLSIGIFSGIESELIDLLIKGLELSLSQWIKCLEKEVEEQTNFLRELKANNK